MTDLQLQHLSMYNAANSDSDPEKQVDPSTETVISG